jgi:hypothetical protein
VLFLELALLDALLLPLPLANDVHCSQYAIGRPALATSEASIAGDSMDRSKASCSTVPVEVLVARDVGVEEKRPYLFCTLEPQKRQKKSKLKEQRI